MPARLFFICCLLFVVIRGSRADIYLHNLKGSNNRHNELGQERADKTLSFDSQNNNRGGYNVGDDGMMYYYVNSILPIQWTNQHSCNDVNADCTVLLQYTCNDALRDGTSTQKIPVTVDGESNSIFRLTEDLTSYLNCRVRSRNKNLYTADQGLTGESSIYTRQNRDGTLYGYECPEERDYYPYWQPTDWIDIAVLTNRQDLCAYYQQNSQNVQSRFACTFNSKNDLIIANQSGIILPNTKVACESFNNASLNIAKPVWREYSSHNQPPPECYTPSHTRENHLGDIRGSEMAVFNWTIPPTSSNKCLVRVRYNISTGDYDGWKTDAASNNKNPSTLKGFFSDDTVTRDRGYSYRNNPQVKLFDDLDLRFQLAINTAQYGRVFEDRSFVFKVLPRPAENQDRPIYNLNVRGRRGNIVQVFPAVEYDFVPSRLEMPSNSYVHIQWIGSNTPPPGDGQGNVQNDRNNLLLLKNQKLDPTWNQFQYLNATGLLITSKPELVNQSTFLNLPRADLRRLAASGENTGPLLNNASAYFDLGARLISSDSSGVYHYVSTRNNDFSNRDQKGRIIVQPFDFKYAVLGASSYSIPLGNAVFKFPVGCVNGTTTIKVARISSSLLSKILPVNGRNIVAKEELYDDAFTIEPYELQFPTNIQVQLPLSVYNNDEQTVRVLQFEPEKGVYMRLPVTSNKKDGTLTFRSDIAGIYALVKTKKSSVWIAGVIIPVALLVIVIISTVVYCRWNPNRYSKVKNQLTNTKRSFFSRI